MMKGPTYKLVHDKIIIYVNNEGSNLQTCAGDPNSIVLRLFICFIWKFVRWIKMKISNVLCICQRPSLYQVV